MRTEQSYVYYGTSTSNTALQSKATTALLVASGAQVIYSGTRNAIWVWPVNSTAAQTGTLLIAEFTNTAKTAPKAAELIRVREISLTDDLTVTADRAAWGLTTGTEYAPKAPRIVPVHPGCKVMMAMSSSSGGAWYVRYAFTETDPRGELVANVQTGDLKFGAVELQDATGTTRAKIVAASSAAVGDNALVVADPVMRVSNAGAYVRQDSTATIAKESGGNLAAASTSAKFISGETNGTLGTIQTLTAGAGASAVTLPANCRGVFIQPGSGGTMAWGNSSAQPFSVPESGMDMKAVSGLYVSATTANGYVIPYT